MTKEFVPYQESLELKKLGFDEPCFGFYIASQLFVTSDIVHNSSDIPVCKAPTFSQAFRWFREKHDLQASNIMFSNGKYDTGITRYKGTQSVWGNGPIYDTYEEAELECLRKLIEIVKGGEQ